MSCRIDGFCILYFAGYFWNGKLLGRYVAAAFCGHRLATTGSPTHPSLTHPIYLMAPFLRFQGDRIRFDTNFKRCMWGMVYRFFSHDGSLVMLHSCYINGELFIQQFFFCVKEWLPFRICLFVVTSVLQARVFLQDDDCSIQILSWRTIEGERLWL